MLRATSDNSAILIRLFFVPHQMQDHQRDPSADQFFPLQSWKPAAITLGGPSIVEGFCFVKSNRHERSPVANHASIPPTTCGKGKGFKDFAYSRKSGTGIFTIRDRVRLSPTYFPAIEAEFFLRWCDGWKSFHLFLDTLLIMNLPHRTNKHQKFIGFPRDRRRWFFLRPYASSTFEYKTFMHGRVNDKASRIKRGLQKFYRGEDSNAARRRFVGHKDDNGFHFFFPQIPTSATPGPMPLTVSGKCIRQEVLACHHRAFSFLCNLRACDKGVSRRVCVSISRSLYRANVSWWAGESITASRYMKVNEQVLLTCFWQLLLCCFYDIGHECLNDRHIRRHRAFMTLSVYPVGHDFPPLFSQRFFLSFRSIDFTFSSILFGFPFLSSIDMVVNRSSHPSFMTVFVTFLYELSWSHPIHLRLLVPIGLTL